MFGIEFLPVLIFLAIYFLPSFISSARMHRNNSSTFVLNLFLGWTFIGWVAALMWALSDNVKNRDE